MTLGLLESYNRTRYVEELLDKTEDKAPSLTIHLHPEHWVLNNGSKFLYHNQMASLLDDIRAHRIPVDFLDLFDEAGVPFYDGCMVVELLDYRAKRSKDPQPEKPDRTRVILHPNPETLYADICALNAKSKSNWSDRDALEIESKLLLATAPPLCLDPTPHLSRIANHVLRASTPTVPMSLKRKASNHEPEEDETEKTRRAKIMAFMAPRNTRAHAPSYTFYENYVRHRREKYVQDHEAPKNPPPPYLNGPPIRPPPKPPTPAPVPATTHAPVQVNNQGHIMYNVGPDNAQSTYPTPAYSAVPTNGQPTHQFVSQASPVAPGITPQVYRSVQEATAAATAQRANTSTPVSNNGAAVTAHQMQLLQQAKIQSQNLSLSAAGHQQQPHPNQQNPHAAAPHQQQPTAPQNVASPVQPPSAISPSTSSNPPYPQPANHYPNQQAVPRPASVAPAQIAMSTSNQSQSGGQQPQPPSVAAPPMGSVPSAGSVPTGGPQLNRTSLQFQQLRMNFMKAQQTFLAAQQHAQANPADIEARRVMGIAHTAYAQEKQKMDAFAASYTKWRQQQQQAQAAQAAGSGGVPPGGAPGPGGQIPNAGGAGMNQTGRATPQSLGVGNGGPPPSAPTPSPARGSPMPSAQGLPVQQQHPQQQQHFAQQQHQNPAMQQQHLNRTTTPAQAQPQAQQGMLQVPNAQQGQQPQPGQQQQGGQFTFAAPYNPTAVAAARTGTPANVTPGQYTFALGNLGINATRVTAGTPVPGGVSVVNAQRSPQQMQAQQQQHQLQAQQQQQVQQQQAMAQQAAALQQMRGTPVMANQQLRTPQTQTQPLRTPQMGPAQLQQRTPQQAQQTQQARTPQMGRGTPLPGGAQAQQAMQQQIAAQMQGQQQGMGQPGQMAQMAQGGVGQMTPQQYQTMQYWYQLQQQQQQQQQAQQAAQAQGGGGNNGMGVGVGQGGQGGGQGGPTPAQIQQAAHLQRIAQLSPQQQQQYWAQYRHAQAQAQAMGGMGAQIQGQGGMQGGGAVMGGVAVGGVPQSGHQFSLSVGGGVNGQAMGQQSAAAMLAAASAAKKKQQQQQQGR